MKELMRCESTGRPVGITNGHITLQEVSSHAADRLILTHHYSKKVTRNRFLSFLVNDGQGALQLGYGIRPHLKHHISPLINKTNYCEFDRMWLSEDLPKFSESQTIALLLSYLKQVHPNIKFVITYADESVGNSGIIYQATNAYRLGGVPVDFYRLLSGERIHPVTMWHRHGTRKLAVMQELYPGIEHIKGGFLQRRYLYILDKKCRREYERAA